MIIMAFGAEVLLNNLVSGLSGFDTCNHGESALLWY